MTGFPKSHMQNHLLVGLNANGNIHLIVGTNSIAAGRCSQSLGAGAKPIIIGPENAHIDLGLQRKISDGLVQWIKREFEEKDLFCLGRDDVGGVVDAVFITDSASHLQSTSSSQIAWLILTLVIGSKISELCRYNRIPVNAIDAPHLCTFTLLSTYTDGPLQIGVTTNGRGCRLAGRIRRAVVGSLPANLGAACERLGALRRSLHPVSVTIPGEWDDCAEQGQLLNGINTGEDAKERQIRWFTQVCEYWPLNRLAAITDADIDAVMTPWSSTSLPTKRKCETGVEIIPVKTGRIILAGSGPGHPDLITHATYRAIQVADLVIADKLVPSSILNLIPCQTPVHIARKFPGNATAAQKEIETLAIDGVQSGKVVLRLKQGDPFVYGRGGEEVTAFQRLGLGSRVTTIPGITSALGAPLLAGIPVTHRGAADQVLICTGTIQDGKSPIPPEYVPSRTVVYLMALHRIKELVQDLAYGGTVRERMSERDTGRALWPLDTPCAVVERASCPDQRVIRSTLEYITEAVDAVGSRPPGLLVIGATCHILGGRSTHPWVVEEGFQEFMAHDGCTWTRV